MHIDNKKKSSSESSKEYCRWVTFARILNPNHLPERAGNLFLLRFSFYLSHTHISLYFPLLTNVEIPPTLTLASTQAAPTEPEQYFSRNFYVIYCNIPKLRQACISRAKVTRPWEPSKGTCPIGHCAVGSLPAAFLFFTGQRHGKKEIFRKTSSALPCLAPRGRPITKARKNNHSLVFGEYNKIRIKRSLKEKLL